MENAKKSIKGTRTEKNLVTAYLAESTAYSRYIFYAKQADKEGYYPVEQLFNETADNELHHAKVFFKFLEGGKVDVPMDVDAGVIGDTAANLATAISEEQNEGVTLYTNAAKVADEEGFPEIASHFRAIAEVEDKHKARFERFLKMVVGDTLWKRDHDVTWRCMVCGYEEVGKVPPQTCPGCDHPYQHYIAVGDFDL